jgi:hypothetical protein
MVPVKAGPRAKALYSLDFFAGLKPSTPSAKAKNAASFSYLIIRVVCIGVIRADRC